MPGTTVWTFFYGSYMNPAVVREIGPAPERWETGCVTGFELVIRPRANLVRAPGSVCYGVVAALTHAELARLYAHAHDVLGETYLPEAVLVQLGGGTARAALCYVCPAMEPRPADAAYVGRIAAPAREYGFPAWYVRRIESFAPAGRGDAGGEPPPN